MRKAIIAVLLLLAFNEVFAKAVDYQAQALSLAISSEPPNLNSMQTSDQLSAFVLLHTNEGLLQYDQHHRLISGVAERWQLSDKGARFWLRKNARWSDGQAVTAHDFVYAWRQVVNPETASSYAFIMKAIKNAESISKGEMPISQLGVVAVNDYELLVQFERPCSYFLSLTAFVSFYPVREDFYLQKGVRYAADKEDLLFNGPYVLSKWVHGASLVLRKNNQYWNRNLIKLKSINIEHITSDNTTRLNLFKNDSIALVDLDADTLETALQDGLNIRQFETGLLTFLRFNFRSERATSNINLRKAMQAVLDPATVVNKIVGLPGIVSAQSLFPWSVKGIASAFRLEYPAPQIKRDLQAARQYMQAYQASRKKLGLDAGTQLQLLCGESAIALRQAEYLQNLFKLALGVDIKIDKQIFKQRLAKERQGQFDISLTNWGPDFDDAITYGDLFASWNANNRGSYVSAQYDHWVDIAQNSSDRRERMQAMNQMQQLIAKDVVILPIYENVEIYVQHPQLHGVVRGVFGGDPNLRFAGISKP